MTSAETVATAHTVVQAYIEFDEVLFTENIGILRGSLDCFDDTLSSTEAITVHQAIGLLNFANGEDERSLKNWHAVRSIDPSFIAAYDLMPESSPLRKIFLHGETPNKTVSITPLRHGDWYVDGEQSNVVPSQRAFLLVAVSDENVLHSGYHYSPFTIPSLETPYKKQDHVAQQKMGAVITTVFGLLAGTALALRQQQIQALQSADTDPMDLYQIRANANGFTVAAEVLGASALIAAGYTFSLGR